MRSDINSFEIRAAIAQGHFCADALTHAAAVDYREQRKRALRRAQQNGTQVLDVAPNLLPVALVNRYLAIKRSGML